MPNITFGSTIASVLMFLAVMTILTIVLNAKTTTGATVLPNGVALNISGLINTENYTYLNQTRGGQVNLQTSLNSQANTTATFIQPGILQSLGGLAFIPAAFGAFINLMVRIPGTMILIVNTLLTQPNNLTAWLGFSLTALSGCLMAYYVVIFGMKVISPVVKTEVEDV